MLHFALLYTVSLIESPCASIDNDLTYKTLVAMAKVRKCRSTKFNSKKTLYREVLETPLNVTYSPLKAMQKSDESHCHVTHLCIF